MLLASMFVVVRLAVYVEVTPGYLSLLPSAVRHTQWISVLFGRMDATSFCVSHFMVAWYLGIWDEEYDIGTRRHSGTHALYKAIEVVYQTALPYVLVRSLSQIPIFE